ncbi:MAG: hypothetical protein KAT90_10965, partial [Gammaproteobacteria bacterium]|nr:hypothetical protein [Gammaproteobacteria bacterium]
GTGTFTETLNGVVQSTAVFTWSITNDLLTITDSITFVDTWAMTTSGLKVYTEDDSMGSDKILDGIADGGIWTGNYIKEGAATLACGYESGWDDVLSAPINPNSFTEYETVLTGCNSIDHGYEAQALTAAEVQALVTNQGLEVTTFNLLGAAVGTEADPGTGVYDDGAGFVININWWVEAATCSGCTHNYVVVYTDTIIEPNLATLVAPGFWMRETSSVIAVVDNDLSGAPTAGDEMQFYKYGEQQNYSDTDRATGSDTEIFISVGNIIQ